MVLPTVRFHDEVRTEMYEIHSIRSHGLLPPELFLHAADVLTDTARAVGSHGDLRNSCVTTPPSPPTPPPRGGRGGQAIFRALLQSFNPPAPPLLAGEGLGERGALPVLDRSQHCLQNGLGVIAYLVIPESQDPESL